MTVIALPAPTLPTIDSGVEGRRVSVVDQRAWGTGTPVSR
ncbi:hypothetical protein [Alloactinosynnema sp. L-07]|nr:hypothetical protein [Alloactinosynnema sp. L-07]